MVSTSLSGLTSVPGRVVRVHREDNGAVVGWAVSDPSTGAWSVDASSAPLKCYAIELDCDDIGTIGLVQTSRMNPSAGSTTFSEYFGNTITSVGDMVSTSSNPPPLTGVATSAYCDGSGDYAQLSNLSKLSPGVGDFCVDVFARPVFSGDNYRTIFNFAYPGGSVHIRYGNSGFGYLLQSSLSDSSLAVVYSCARSQSSDDGAWGLYSLERYNGTLRLYYNGVIQNLNSGASPGSFPYSAIADKTDVSGVTGGGFGTGFLGNIGPWRILNLAPYRGNNFSVPSAPWQQSFGSGDVNALILSGLIPG